MKVISYDILIIGGGASGCAAAVAAKKENPALRIGILEKNKDILRKVLASGNGRCNISNRNCETVAMTEDFFYELGIIFAQEEEGRLYPYNRSAATVPEAFKRAFKKLGIDVYCNANVTGITEDHKVLVKGGAFEADKILIAAGGKSYPEFGTTGDGYIFARKLGHELSPLRPVLTALTVKEELSAMKGVREDAKAVLWKNGIEVASETGQIQFTEDGISGIAIFNLSSHVVLDRSLSLEEAFSQYEVTIDFLPDLDEDAYRRLLEEGCVLSLAKKQTLKSVGKENLKSFKVTLSGAKGWKQAQVTAGGVSYGEVDQETMESKVAPGIYFAGEMMDYDGPCGGYNLNHAWTTGIKAGRAMAKACTR